MNKLCFCGRQASGFGYDPRLAGAGLGPTVSACSLPHLNIITNRKGNMHVPTPLTKDEYNSIMEASPEIGAHLESTGITDMAKMSIEQWYDHITFVYQAICERNAARWADGDVPY